MLMRARKLIVVVLMGLLINTIYSSVAWSYPKITYVITTDRSTDYLNRISGNKIQRTLTLGTNTTYGVGGQKIVLLSGKDVKKSWRWILTIIDYKSGIVMKKHIINAEPVTWLSGPERTIALDEKGETAFFITLETSATRAWHALAVVDLASGKLSKFPLPEDLSNPRVLQLNSGLGVYSWNNTAFYEFSDGKFLKRRHADDYSIPALTNVPTADPRRTGRYLFHPDLGAVYITDSGTYALLDKLQSASDKSRSKMFHFLGTAVRDAQIAIFEKRPVLVYGQRIAGTKRQTAISHLVIYDPVAQKELWRKKLPVLAKSFVVSPDTLNFRIIDLVTLSLQYYDRRRDNFSEKIVLPVEQTHSIVVVPTY